MGDHHQEQVPNRCRLILTACPGVCDFAALEEALKAGDVASAILYAGDSDALVFEAFCKEAVPTLQRHNCAVLIADDTQVFGRSGADGYFLEKQRKDLNDAIARFSPQKIVGCGGIKDRHGALLVGEAKPDFIFLGKLGGDIKPDAHPKNIALANWWSELVEIPIVVMGGNDLNSVVECAKNGAEFVALERAVFDSADLVGAIRHANELLDENAPTFDEDELQT